MRLITEWRTDLAAGGFARNPLRERVPPSLAMPGD
jgi:hypothetical protein